MKNNNQNLKNTITQGQPQADRSVSINSIETEFLELLKREIGIFAFEFLTLINPLRNEDEKKIELERVIEAVKSARALGLSVNAGHGLDYKNVAPIAKIKEIEIKQTEIASKQVEIKASQSEASTKITEIEAKTYLACLELGSETVQNIAKKGQIKRPTCYVTLDNLFTKGYVAKIEKKSTTLYAAEDPKIMLNKYKEKTRLKIVLQLTHIKKKEMPKNLLS